MTRAFLLDRNLSGADHRASLELQELEALVRSVRKVEQALCHDRKLPVLLALKNKSVACKSLGTVSALKKGEILTEENLIAKRPGTGIAPWYYWERLGQPADRDYAEDEQIGRKPRPPRGNRGPQ